MSKFIDAFKSAPSATRRLFLAQMDIDHTDPESRDLHRVLTELHEQLNLIQGDEDE
jgi:hypothetical protein